MSENMTHGRLGGIITIREGDNFVWYNIPLESAAVDFLS
jgi:hypothetical protein